MGMYISVLNYKLKRRLYSKEHDVEIFEYEKDGRSIFVIATSSLFDITIMVIPDGTFNNVKELVEKAGASINDFEEVE